MKEVNYRNWAEMDLEKAYGLLEARLSSEGYKKIRGLDNPHMHRFVAAYIELCDPGKVFVSADLPEDIQYIRDAAVANHEEARLALEGHTVHFDGYRDQARDKKATKFLLPKGVDLGPEINAIDRDEGLEEVHAILKGIMKGREAFVLFFCLGPTDSEFSIPVVQITDSAYVAHSESLLYRPGYAEFGKLGRGKDFFKLMHSQGELEAVGLGLGVSKNVDKRRVYIDLPSETQYSTNTQYGGNTIGLKKLSMRLAINRASKEGWLTEHMMVMGVHGPGGRTSYFLGAFPSMCGKTATSMVSGEVIVGDDIAYLRNKGGHVRAVNAEKGIFGIIQDVNSKDDPVIWNALHTKAEIIFSNVLVSEDKIPYWMGKDGEMLQKGVNHSGDWTPGKRDADGNEITPSHKNARYTLDMDILDNLDPNLNNPQGVEVSGIIYGGRDSDTWVPVEESFDWPHGIITKGASLESETTAATLGKEGVRVFNPMSNMDFLSIPIGRYIDINLAFGQGLKHPPKVFSVNYFLRDSNGGFMNSKQDKRVWLKWMELRAAGDAAAIKTPTGYIPHYEDLKRLFREVLDREYTLDEYNQQFTIRVPQCLSKIARIMEIYKTRVNDTPAVVFEVLEKQKARLEKAAKKLGDFIKPAALAGE